MPLSLSKLEKLLSIKGLIATQFFTIDKICVYIEILAVSNADTFLLYIPSKYKIKFLSKFYWRFMHNPNIDVIDISAFTEHDILPMIGLRPKV